MRIFILGLGVTFIVISLALPAYGVCTKKTTLQDVLKTSKAGETAFADMDLTNLLVHSTSLRDDVLPCLKEKITPRVAAAFHRIMALEAFTKNKRDRVVREFHAARRLDPGYEIPKEVAEKEHPLRKLYAKALMAPDGAPEIVYPPKGGYISVGGIRNAPRPGMTPVVIQVFKKGVLTETRYLQPGETLPVWGVNPNLVNHTKLQPSVLTKPKFWYVSAGVMAVIAGGLYAYAMHQKSQFQNTDGKDTAKSDKALEGFQSNANTFGGWSLAVGGLALVSTGVGAGFQFTAKEKKSPLKVTANDR